MNVRILKPTDGEFEIYGLTIFLAGSIEMGSAGDWQNDITERIEELDLDFPVDVLNPRRDSWDSSWKQEESNREFNHQVNWEMNKLDRSDVIFMYFSPETKSPVSLLELGLYADSGKIIVCCPDGFWRKGNIEIVCSRYRIPLYHNLDDAFGGLLTKIKTINKI